ncbi:unnamed protein product [Knipowitschia caucasica]|uniref:C-type lectin domain-containing protein n=1 Tax=Knipowitschia caucasica TaxID=637954 RepID=A0AAV2LJI9_KNICA
MAAYFRSSSSDISIEVGEYQEIPLPSKPKCKHLNAVVLSFGVLCVLQGALNIALRLTLRDCTAPPAPPAPPAPNTTEESSLCPPLWFRFDTLCFFISQQRNDFDFARNDCQIRGARLAKLHNRRQQDFLTARVQAAWIGMTDRGREGEWRWLDGFPVDRDGLLWAPGQPDNVSAEEDCGNIQNQRNFVGLNDSPCSNLMQWICERPVKQTRKQPGSDRK